jgi:DNA polymerase sigma
MVYDFDSDEYNKNVSKKIAGKLVKDIDEAYGTATTSQPSSATVRSQGTVAATDNRRATNTELKASRQSSNKRRVAGSNYNATAARSVSDPSDDQRNQNSAQSNANSQEIDRLKDLVMKVARGR